MLDHSWSIILLFGLHTLDIQAIERVQRRFTKNLPGFRMYSYSERLHRLNMQSLELRRLLTDLVWCYKVVFCLVDINVDDFFSLSNSVVRAGFTDQRL